MSNKLEKALHQLMEHRSTRRRMTHAAGRQKDARREHKGIGGSIARGIDAASGISQSLKPIGQLAGNINSGINYVGNRVRDAKKMGNNIINKVRGTLGFNEGGSSDRWIQNAVKHPGSLHRALGVPMDKKIPERKIEKAEHSHNPALRRKARLAETLRGFKH